MHQVGERADVLGPLGSGSERERRVSGWAERGKWAGRGRWAGPKTWGEEEKRFLKYGNKHISIEFKFEKFKFKRNSNKQLMHCSMNARQTKQPHLI